MTLALEDTQERLQAEQRSYGRKLTSITSDYERKITGLINHTGMSDLLQAAIDRTDSTVGVEGGEEADGTESIPDRDNIHNVDSLHGGSRGRRAGVGLDLEGRKTERVLFLAMKFLFVFVVFLPFFACFSFLSFLLRRVYEFPSDT